MALDQLLKFLQGHSSSDPVSFTCISSRLRLRPVRLNILLDQLYEQREINQAFVTKDGRKQRMVWPTGVVGFIDNYYAKHAKKSPTIPPPRRDETKPKLEETMTQDMTQDLEVATLEKPPVIASQPVIASEARQSSTVIDCHAADAPGNDATPKALAILNFIEPNPVCNSAQIIHATGIEYPRAYIKAHIKGGSVLVTGEGRLDQYLQLAPNQTAEAIYNNGYTKPAAKPAIITETALPAFNLSAADDAQIPVFITSREDEVPDEATNPKFDSDLGFYADTALKTITNPFSQDDFAIDAINTLFDLLPPQSAIVIGRSDGALQIDIEADVFGTPVTKMVQLNEVISTLNALHIVTVEMA